MNVKQFARIVEIRTKLVSVSTFTIASLYVLYSSSHLSMPLLLLTFAAALCVDMGTTGFNTYFDFVRGVDNRIYNLESDKVLVHDGMSARDALAVSLGVYAVAVVLGAILAAVTSLWIAVVGALCMAVGFLYTGGPYPISRTPVGELFAGGFLGTIFFLIACFVQTERVDVSALPASLPSTLMIMSILTVNNTCDIVGDRAAGRRTFSIVVGPRGGEVTLYLLGAFAYALAAVLSLVGVLPIWTLITLALSLVLVVPTYREMHRTGFSHSTKGASMGRISRVFVLFSVAVAAGLAIGTIIRAGSG